MTKDVNNSTRNKIRHKCDNTNHENKCSKNSLKRPQVDITFHFITYFNYSCFVRVWLDTFV